MLFPFLRFPLALGPEFQVEHTVNEKKILDVIDHPFLVKLYGTFQDDHNLYMIMEYVVGGELFTYLRRNQVCCLPLTCFLSPSLGISVDIFFSSFSQALFCGDEQILRGRGCVRLRVHAQQKHCVQRPETREPAA